MLIFYVYILSFIFSINNIYVSIFYVCPIFITNFNKQCIMFNLTDLRLLRCGEMLEIWVPSWCRVLRVLSTFRERFSSLLQGEERSEAEPFPASSSLRYTTRLIVPFITLSLPALPIFDRNRKGSPMGGDNLRKR